MSRSFHLGGSPRKLSGTRLRVRAMPLAWLAGMVPLLLSGAAAAQSSGLAIGRFDPSPAGDRFFGVPSEEALPRMAPGVKAVLDYAHDPLVLETRDGDDRLGEVVEHQMFLHLDASLGLFERVLLDIDLPIAVWQDGSNPTQYGFRSPDSAEVGDLRLGARGTLFESGEGSFRLGLGAFVWLPTGPNHAGTYVTDDRVRGEPMVLIGGKVNRFVYAGSVGPEFRPSRDVLDTQQGTMLKFRAGAAFLLGANERWQLGPEATLSTVLADPSERNLNGEAIAGLKYRAPIGLQLGIGAGPGLSSGIGTPDFRGLLEIGFAPRGDGKRDRDGDGVLDQNDACPLEAGLRSDDPSKNGCPAADRDRDGVLDAEDACPDEPGKASTDPSSNGCPDRDGDGIIDRVDACPDQPGVATADPAKNGCPADADGDGVLDEVDACPDEPGIKSDISAKNGCPPDRDGDGVADALDACPDVPGVASDDPAKRGCPADRDGDGVPDSVDACPDQKGMKSEDAKKTGCPVVEVRGSELVILEKVQFDTNQATIKPESGPLLEQIANTLKEHPEIQLAEVQGHTDDRGGAALNDPLSRDRAAAVLKALVERGVEAKRLTSRGFGSRAPIASNATPEGREKNRRVEIKILKQEKK